MRVGLPSLFLLLFVLPPLFFFLQNPRTVPPARSLPPSSCSSTTSSETSMRPELALEGRWNRRRRGDEARRAERPRRTRRQRGWEGRATHTATADITMAEEILRIRLCHIAQKTAAAEPWPLPLFLPPALLPGSKLLRPSAVYMYCLPQPVRRRSLNSRRWG